MEFIGWASCGQADQTRTVNALGALRKEGDAACTATSGSTALAQVVQRQKLKQTR